MHRLASRAICGLVMVLAAGCSRREEPLPRLAAGPPEGGPADSGAGSAVSDPQAKVSAWGPDGGSKPSDQETFVSELVVDGLGAYWAKSDGTIYGQSTGAKEPRLLAHLHDRITGLALGKTRLSRTARSDPSRDGQSDPSIRRILVA